MSNLFLYLNLTNNKRLIRKLWIITPTLQGTVTKQNSRRQYSDKTEIINNKNDSGIIVPKLLKFNFLVKEKYSLAAKYFEKFPQKDLKYNVADEIIYQRITNKLLQYIEQISHMDEVRDAQKNVMNIKDKLKESGDAKRGLLYRLSIIRNDLQKKHNDIMLSTRGTERFLQLMTDEMVLLKDEKNIQLEFNEADELERQLFNQLTSAINDSYEKEKIHSNFIKVLGVIGALVGSILTLIASAVGHFYHNTKFGMLAIDFKESVTKTLHSELGSLKDALRFDISKGMKKQEDLLKKIQKTKEKNSESWGGYIHRHSVNVYRYFIPRSKQ